MATGMTEADREVVLSVHCTFKNENCYQNLGAGRAGFFFDARDELRRVAEAAPGMFAMLCGDCREPCDGRLMVASISSRAWYFEDRCDAIKAVHAAWSLLALEAIEIKPDCK